MKERLTKKLPDILLESLFIIIALLGALALEEWREQNEKMELADRAKQAILQELSDNQKQLEKKLPIHQAMLKTLSEELEQFESTPNKTPEFDFNYSMALLTSAAWDSARMTQSVQFMSFEEVSEFSKIYRFQSLYVENQQKLIEKIMQIGDVDDQSFGQFTKGFIHRLRLLIEVNQMLVSGYKNFRSNENTSQDSEN